jgi:hypothetical protein
MNTDKLLKAIQILVQEEVKQQLPALIKEGIKAEMKKLMAEEKIVKPKSEGLSMAKAILNNNESITESKKEYSKNPMINQILNETRQAVSNDNGYRTMSFGQSDMGSIVGRTAIAEKMGYGDFANGPQKTGLGVQTGVAELDKAFNRDYSELVKRFKK